MIRHVADVPQRRMRLTPAEVLLLNPNTGTLPLFRSRVDAEITLGIYRRYPVLMRGEENPWAVSFARLFDMTNDASLFHDDLALLGSEAAFDGWSWKSTSGQWLPLYEAKMLSHWDHRYSTYAGATEAQLRMNTLPRIDLEGHDDPGAEPRARYWVSDGEVVGALSDSRQRRLWDRGWFLGWRDITNATNERSFIPFVFPRAAAGNPILLAMPSNHLVAPYLQATWSSLVFDYIARQKLSGTHMNYFVVRQLACPAPETFRQATTWDRGDGTLGDWVLGRVLELSYTSYRLAPYARDLGDDGPPFRWDPARRELIRAELDGAMFHVYGLERPEVEHVLDSFFVVRKYEERDHGEFRTKRLVLAAYDAMAEAIRTGIPFRTSLDPAPGHGPRHPWPTSEEPRP